MINTEFNKFYDENLINKVHKKLNELLDEVYNDISMLCEETGRINPIDNYKTREKKLSSLKDKLERKGYNIDDFLSRYLLVEDVCFDIVAGRIVCLFSSDISFIESVIRKKVEESNGILEICEIKNYVEKPKDAGYSSYHLILGINIDGKQIKTEIQIRTFAMDWAASVDHKLRYKNKGSDELDIRIKALFDLCKDLDVDFKKTLDTLKSNQSEKFYLKLKEEYIDYKNKSNMALDTVEYLFNSVNVHYDKFGLKSPIEHIIKVIKSDNKVIKKLNNKGKEVNFENITKYINDFASFKVVCTFLSEVQDMKYFIEEFAANNKLRIIERNDYINNPKKNGYRGFHYLVEVPIYDNNNKLIEFRKVMIQLWTTPMQMWANLEDELVYYRDECDEEVIMELQRVSSNIGVIDNDLDTIYMDYSPLIEGCYDSLEYDNSKRKIKVLKRN